MAKKLSQLGKYLMDYWEDEINVDGDMYETEVDIAIRLLERLRRIVINLTGEG